jgi:Rhodopirellula transposase DDE domain
MITVCHYPPGASKWNKIEHRMFSFISMNWRGQPLVSYETIVDLIGHTKTEGGLKIKASLDTKRYEPGRKVSATEMDAVQVKRHATFPRWNYTITPHRSTS